MATGITQVQVNTAADALVFTGVRPTVDRIRAFLGTGSPNTVTRMLEVWWQGLGPRLRAQQARADLPSVPEAVAGLAAQLWEAALEAAHAEAASALSHQADAVAAQAAQLDTDRAALVHHSAALDAAVDVARQAQTVAEARLAEAQALIAQQAAHVTDLLGQRDSAHGKLEALQRIHVETTEQLARHMDAAAAERDALSQHVRAVEDRAHQEVDRARQDAKSLQAQLAAAGKERDALAQQLRDAREAALKEAARQQQEAAAQRARAEALEEQLHRLNAAVVPAQKARGARATSPKATPKRAPSKQRSDRGTK
ncbi:MAG: DNA-binding protein [Lysobacter sp.]|nr:MAG: DNA-binding protein [Lysobacter sp.]